MQVDPSQFTKIWLKALNICSRVEGHSHISGSNIGRHDMAFPHLTSLEISKIYKDSWGRRCPR